MKTLLKNATLLDCNGQKVKKDILINDGIIISIGDIIIQNDATEIDLDEKFVSPGFVDVHVHLRDPGVTHKETIKTGAMAALRGGYTQIAAMPNTRPVPDCVETLTMIQEKVKADSKVKIHIYSSITERQLGEQLVDFQGMTSQGAFAFSDDGVGMQSAGKMYEAMLEAKKVGKPIVAHCEDNSLLYGGVIHEGTFSKENNLPGILSVSESTQIARDILLAEATGAQYHVCHISAKESVRVIADGKRAGIHVTAEVSPHHLLLADEDIKGESANFKMNPPLRGVEDRKALVEGLLNGTIDMIATDHAPHTEDEKALGMKKAPFGIVGLETAFPLLYTHLVETNICSLAQLVHWMSTKPAEVFRLQGGKIEVGEVADLTIIDLEKEQPINKNEFLSKGKNTPFDGYMCKGWPVMTIVDGEIVWKEEVK